MIRLIAVVILALPLAGCLHTQSLPSGVGRAQFCDIYRPVLWSPADTRKTKEQADVMNRQWKRLCKKQ